MRREENQGLVRSPVLVKNPPANAGELRIYRFDPWIGKSTGCPHQHCILKDHSGPGLSLLVKGGMSIGQEAPGKKLQKL